MGMQSNDQQKLPDKVKKSNGPKTAQQCLESISNMFAFDWALKEIGNLKNNPCKLNFLSTLNSNFLTFSYL